MTIAKEATLTLSTGVGFDNEAVDTPNNRTEVSASISPRRVASSTV